jgi:oleate hydratase
MSSAAASRVSRVRYICIFEESKNYGGALDASGDAQSGYIMRGGRMFEEHYVCTYDLLSNIPSYDNPDISARDDIFNFMREASWRSMARLIDHAGKPIDVFSMGFDNRDRLALLWLILRSEDSLGVRRIDVFPPHFFTTNFWLMWCTMFSFQLTRPAVLDCGKLGGALSLWKTLVAKQRGFGHPEVFIGDIDKSKWLSFTVTTTLPLMRRYLLRFIHLFPTIADLSSVYHTRYNQYHSIVLLRQLFEHLTNITLGREGLITFKESDWLMTLHPLLSRLSRPARGGHRVVGLRP